MTSVQSYIFDFQRVPLFFSDWNIMFNVWEMQVANTDKYEFVFCDVAPDNIYDCLSGSVLNTNRVHIQQTVNCSLKYEDEIISVNADATWNVGDNVYPIKAVFLRRKSNGYVMGYSINNVAFEVTNVVKIEKDTILWSIVDG